MEGEYLMHLYAVCGLHRSGTTFVGKLLRKGGVCIVHEPLNEDFGMEGVSIAYPYVTDEVSTYQFLLNDMVKFQRVWSKDSSHVTANSIRKNIYALTGGRSGLRWWQLRFRMKFGFEPRQVCFKDPFMSLATPYVVKKHRIKTVCMVRHPAAIHYSTAKQGWRFDIQNLRRQGELIAAFAEDISDKQWQLAEHHAAASIAILWKLMIRVNQKVQQESLNLKMIRHEDLCLYPLETAEKICSHLEVPFTSKMRAFVETSSQGQEAEAKEGKVHSFQRDTKALVNIWKEKGNKQDYQLIKDIAEQELKSMYGDESGY
jgi:hypothetical protein